VIAYLGQGGNWSIMEHMQKLITRQQDHVKKKRKEEDQLHVQTYKYKSNILGQAGIDDCVAKKVLSAYAYKELFCKAQKQSQYLESREEEDGTVHIWPAGVDKNTCNVTIMHKDASGLFLRCPCQKRKDYNIQCACELLRDGKFILGKYHHTWYNNHLFKEIYPQLSHLNNNVVGTNNAEIVAYDDIINTTIVEKTKASTSIGYNHYDQFEECDNDEYMTQTTANTNNEFRNVTYQELMSRFE